MFQGYVINLDSRPDRLAKFNQHPDSRYFLRQRAVDREDILRIGKEIVFNIPEAERQISCAIGLGEIACTLSHIACWRKIAENEALDEMDFAVIAEDDVTLCPYFSTYFQQITQSLAYQEQYGLVLLQQLPHPLYHPEEYPLIRQINTRVLLQPYQKLANGASQTQGSSLYALRKNVAKQLIQALDETKPFWQADQFKHFIVEEATLLALPNLGKVLTHQADSDLEQERQANLLARIQQA